MLVLGIETSCDETSAAVVRDGTLVLSCVIASSRKDFETVGGVIPEEAARRQLEVILDVTGKALSEAGTQAGDLDAIAVTYGPGLIGSLLVGTFTARTLAEKWQKPLIPVHHTLGHLSSVWLTKKADTAAPVFPCITLSVSGGHTDLWYRVSHTKGMLLGRTLDDAAGEAFDKGAVLLGLPYPGGPALAKLAESGDESAYALPSPLRGSREIEFSFSGLKTSLKYLLRDLPDPLPETMRASVAASYQLAICRHLEDRLTLAVQKYPDTKEIHLVGGVSANTRLRSVIGALGKKHGVAVRHPEELRYCTDNGAMIASAGHFLTMEKPTMSGTHFETCATVSLSDVVDPISTGAR